MDKKKIVIKKEITIADRINKTFKEIEERTFVDGQDFDMIKKIIIANFIG